MNMGRYHERERELFEKYTYGETRDWRAKQARERELD